jgi:hypothetical protein
MLAEIWLAGRTGANKWAQGLQPLRQRRGTLSCKDFAEIFTYPTGHVKILAKSLHVYCGTKIFSKGVLTK